MNPQRNKIGTNDGRDRKKAARPFFCVFREIKRTDVVLRGRGIQPVKNAVPKRKNTPVFVRKTLFFSLQKKRRCGIIFTVR
ncbi:MAG TPA: hypothetical protein DCX90_03075 [Ruminococcaceae bacterium]|nr:hypothetical protein [Oscillospiraceae bacterium]